VIQRFKEPKLAKTGERIADNGTVMEEKREDYGVEWIDRVGEGCRGYMWYIQQVRSSHEPKNVKVIWKGCEVESEEHLNERNRRGDCGVSVVRCAGMKSANYIRTLNSLGYKMCKQAGVNENREQ
jgi:hypothetical protein